MLQAAGMSPGFWEFAVATAVHVQNQAPSQVVRYVSPHERLLKSAPDLSYLRTFSCLAYAHTTTQRTKYDPMSQKLVFIGYDNSTKGYKLWNPLSHIEDILFGQILPVPEGILGASRSTAPELS